MALEMHFVDVGFGNMTLIRFPAGVTYLYDCNITEENEDDVFTYLKKAMGNRRRLQAFICSHRDADHMRGCKKVHKKYPITVVLDAGVEGTTTNSAEYNEYMELRRDIGFEIVRPRTKVEIGEATVRYMNAKDSSLSGANDQSIVMKVEYKGSSALLAADTSYIPWRDKILPHYSSERLSADILLASHHGSTTFFNDPPHTEYEGHMKRIKPDMTLLSVGSNGSGLPSDDAIRLYKRHTTGSKKGNKIRRTDKDGNMKLTLKDDGAWALGVNQ